MSVTVRHEEEVTALAAASGEEYLSQGFVYFVSPRGGNNYWARLLNGCDKVPAPGYGTVGVGFTDNGKFVLLYDPEWVRTLTPEALKLALIHEAGHIALRHHERYFRILSTVQDKDLRVAVTAAFNIAADLSDNDAVLRHESGFQACLEKKELAPLLPERYGLPKDRSFEDYVLMIANTKTAKQMAKDFNQLADETESGSGKQGQSKGTDACDGDAESSEAEGQSGGSGDSSEGKGGGSSSSSSGAKGSQKGPASFSDDPDDSISDDMNQMAKDHPQLVKDLAEAFARLTRGSHRHWVEKATQMTAEEAMSASNKLKRHSQQLAKNAWEQTVKTRGLMPGHIQRLIQPLLKDEQVPWHWIFADCVKSQISSKLMEGVAQPNCALINESWVEPWPGHVLDNEFYVAWVTDTSGSMSDVEFARARAVFNAMMDQDKRIRCRHIQVDAQIQHEADVDNIDPPEPSRDGSRYGYGGTVYTPAFRRILGVDRPTDWAANAARCEEPPKKPDLVIVYTDGFVGIEGEVLPEYHPGCPLVWLLAPGCRPALGMNDIPPDRLIQMFHIGEREE